MCFLRVRTQSSADDGPLSIWGRTKSPCYKRRRTRTPTTRHRVDDTATDKSIDIVPPKKICKHSTMAHMLPLCTLFHCVICFFVLRCVIFGGAEAWLSDATAERTEDRTKITINKRFVDSKAERIFRASRWQPVGCALVRVDKGKGSRWGLVVGVCWLAEQARSETKIQMRCGTMLGYMWCERRR